MGNVTGDTFYHKKAELFNKLVQSIFILFTILILVNCSQGQENVSATPRGELPEDVPPIEPPPYDYISTMNLQGGSTIVPVSATRRMSIHSFGGTNLRVMSSSGSFRLTAGIGVD